MAKPTSSNHQHEMERLIQENFDLKLRLSQLQGGDDEHVSRLQSMLDDKETLLQEARGVVESLRDELTNTKHDLEQAQAKLESYATTPPSPQRHTNNKSSNGTSNSNKSPNGIDPQPHTTELDRFHNLAFQICGSRKVDALSNHLQQSNARFKERIELAENNLQTAVERLSTLESNRRLSNQSRTSTTTATSKLDTSLSSSSRRALFSSPPLVSSKSEDISPVRIGGGNSLIDSQLYLSPSSQHRSTRGEISLLGQQQRSGISSSTALAKFDEISNTLRTVPSILGNGTGLRR